ncbi:MAG: sugar MFS transporter, partial [Reichenbachiella sp.]
MAGGNVSSSTAKVSDGAANQSYAMPLTVLTTLFFMWGFITCMNDILIPHLKEVFTLNYTQAMLVQSAFFGAYFIISLIYFIISVTSEDPIAKYGYKKAIIVGLLISALGCTLFIPAASYESYGFFLGALFVLASGITILQMGANPYVSLLGKPEGASMRLNMTQAFNSLGTTIAPLVGGVLILGAASAGADAVKMPYMALAATLLALVALIAYAKLPSISTGDEEEAKPSKGKGALAFPHLILGVVCIFMYVGGEVSVGSAVINYLGLDNVAGLSEDQAHPYLALFWGGAMVGRFFAAVFLQESEKDMSFYLKVLGVTVFAFFLGWYLTDMTLAFSFLGLVVLNIVAFFIGQSKPGRSLGLFALIVITMIIIGIVGSGALAMWSIVGIGLFNSIMFPTIFTLAIKGLGVDTGQGSSLLVMAIVGGAIIPVVMGAVADATSIQIAFLVPIVCYAYIAYYGFIGSKPKA